MLFRLLPTIHSREIWTCSTDLPHKRCPLATRRRVRSWSVCGFHDPEAWCRLVHLYGPVIYVWSQRAGLQSHDASDVTQEVLHAVSSNIARFRRERPSDSFRGWLRSSRPIKSAITFGTTKTIRIAERIGESSSSRSFVV